MRRPKPQIADHDITLLVKECASKHNLLSPAGQSLGTLVGVVEDRETEHSSKTALQKVSIGREGEAGRVLTRRPATMTETFL